MKSMILAILGSIIMMNATQAKTTVPVLKSTVAVTTNPLHSVRVNDMAGLLVNGTLDVTQFITQNGKLWAVCKLRGIFCGLPIDEDCLVPISIGDCEGGPIRELTSSSTLQPKSVSGNYHCDCLTIIFGNCTVRRLTGAVIELLPCQLQCTAANFPVQIICTINGGIREISTPIETIAGWMNELL